MNIFEFFTPQFVMQFVSTYIATKGADVTVSAIKGQPQSTIYSVDEQFVNCLNLALERVCSYAGWEYDDNAIRETLQYTVDLVKDNHNLEMSLPDILSKAVGHPFDKNVLPIWEDNFIRALTLPENEKLYKYILFYNTIKSKATKYDAKHIYNYFVKPFSSFTNNAVKRRLEDQLHNIVESYSENDIISSSSFYEFFQQYLRPILPPTLEGFSLDNIELDVHYMLSCFYSFFVDMPHDEQNNAVQLISTYIIFYLNALSKFEGINTETDTVRSSVRAMFISFQEQRNVSTTIVQTGKILKKARRTVDNFAHNMERELPFEIENGRRLMDVYVAPEYRFAEQIKTRDNIFELINSFINRKIKTFFEKERIVNPSEFGYYNILFILGRGGMGKSSLLSKLAYEIQKEGTPRQIFFLKFSRIKDHSGNILNDIICQLTLSEDDLRQSVIVLDAYDEFVLGEQYNKDHAMKEFCAALYRIDSVAIITTRPGYINTTIIGNCFSVVLCTFSREKRALWASKYDPLMDLDVLQGILDYQDLADEKGDELIGIPIILYMVAANNIQITKFKSKYMLYNRLFGARGLWIDRRYDESHPLLQKIQNEIYFLIQNIALMIFNQRNGLSVSRNHIESLIEKNDLEDRDIIISLKQCYPLVTYFKNNFDLTEIEFAHKSIYEFYVADKLLHEIDRLLNMETITSDAVVEFALQLKGNCLSDEILEFYSEMIKQKQKSSVAYAKTLRMLELLTNGYLSILKNPFISNFGQACNSFLNAFTVISKALGIFLHSGYIEVQHDTLVESLRFYLSLPNYIGRVCLAHFNLKGIKLARMYCRNVDFSFANLEEADLSGGDFTKAIFYEASLKGANLYAAVLSYAVLVKADLRDAFLRSTLFNRSDISNFVDVCIDAKQIWAFIPEIYYQSESFRIYQDQKELNEREKATILQDERGF